MIDTIQALAKRRKTHLYLVGGYLRDKHLGKSGTDLDFAVGKDALGLARALSRQIKGAFVLLDKDHGSARVVKRIDGTIYTYDFTDLRGNKGIAGDLKLRDFTVNTFCVDIATGKDLSPSSALKDLKTKTVRMVGLRSFKDDPLRLLRAFSLSAQTGFKIDTKTLGEIKKDAHLITNPAMERVREELFKVLHSPRAFKTLGAMDRIGLLERIMPHIAVMRGVKQGGYHHLDVWKHSLELINQLEQLVIELDTDLRLRNYLNEEIGGGHKRLALIKLAALFHDIGKPQTLKQEVDRTTFHGHEHVGERITRLAAKHLKVSVKERYFLEDAVRMHLRPGYLSNFKRPSQKAVFRFMREAKDEAVSIAILAMADQRSTRGPKTTEEKEKHHAETCRMLIEEYFKEKSKPVKLRLLTGHDLIKGLKLKPSPQFAEILTAVDEAQALGKITTKEQALTLARQMQSIAGTVKTKESLVRALLEQRRKEKEYEDKKWSKY